MKKVRLRSIILGTLLVVINCYWVGQMEFVWEMGHPTRISLFFNTIFTLFLLTFLNLLIKKYFPQTALSQGELLVVYIILSLTTAIVGTDLIHTLVPIMGHAFWFNSPENEWASLFWQYLPQWLVVKDQKVLEGFYKGESSFYTLYNITAWLKPVILWSLFTIVLLFVMLCMNVLLRKQWSQKERLTYPIIQLPMRMTQDGGSIEFFRNRFLWIGFGIAGGIDLLNGFHSLFPSVPHLSPWVTGLGRYFTSKPWNAIGWTPVAIHPFIIGLGYFIPLELSFSCWFFYLFWKVQNIVGSIGGWRGLPLFPYPDEQSFGAYLGFGVLALWASRRHIIQVIKRAIGMKSTLEDSSEPMRYRTAFFGTIVGLSFLFGFCMFAGMSPLIIILFFIIYYVLSISITRMRAECGPPMHDLHYADPGRMLTSALGPRRLGGRNLAMFSLMYWFTRSYRGHPMAHQLEGFKMTEQTDVKRKKLVSIMVFSSIIGAFVAFWALLDLSYKYGLSAGVHGHGVGFGRETFNRLQSWLYNPSLTDYPSIAFIVVGFLLTGLLVLIRRRFLWWPLHPIGYAISGSWSMNLIWFQLFLSWLIKKSILKYGSLKLYRKMIPFFLGLILGEYTVGSIWIIIGLILNIRVYAFW